MYNRLLLFIFIPALLATGGCGSTKKTSGGTVSRQGAELPEEERIKATYAFFDAQKEKLSGNEQRAAELFAQCLRIDPRNHAAMYELSSIYNEKGKIADALYFIRTAVSLDPENEWYLLLLADTYEKSGKYAEAIDIYRQLGRKHPDRIDYLFSESDALLMQGKLSEAIKVYDRIEEVIGVNQEMIMQKQRLYLKLGKVDEAAAELEKLIQSEPGNLDHYSLLVELWQANGRNEKAMETIRRMQQIDPDNPGIALALAEQYRSEGKKAESFEELKKAFSSAELDSDVKLRILLSYVPLVETSEEMMQQALELCKRLSQTHPGEATAQTIYGDFLNMNKQYADARTQYRAGLALDKKNLQAWQQLLYTESELADFNAMETEAEEAQGLFPDQSIIYLFNGIAKIQNKKYEDAARTLLSGSKLVVDNDEQQMDFYSNLGDVYNKLKQYESSDKYYQKALSINPNNAFVLNNWAYYLSLRNVELEKAAEMSRRSIDLDAKNANFLDTYGWILYQQKKYEDALIWLEKARLNGGDNNGTVLEHYGDALYKSGRTNEALEYWEKAKKTGDHSEWLDKKLSEKKLYE